MYANVLNTYERGEVRHLPAGVREELRAAAASHCRMMQMLQRDILAYQWHSADHGWGSLLAQQQHDLGRWMQRLERVFEIQAGAEGWPAVVSAEAAAEGGEIDGLALAARLMADFEGLEQGIGHLWELAESYEAEGTFGLLLGMGYFYHRSAGIYRQYLCASSVALGQAATTGVDWPGLGEE